MKGRSSWNTAFEPPVPVPAGGGTLRTLRDADNHIGRLPKREQQQPAWKDAAGYLVKAAADPAWCFFARRAVYIALHGDARTAPARRPSKDEQYRERRKAWKAAKAGQ